jgi:hypothetical protein
MRIFLVYLTIVGASLLGCDTTDPVLIRKNIDNLNEKELQNLRRGIEVMKSRDNLGQNDPHYTRSWKFWTNMHGAFISQNISKGLGSSCRDDSSAQFDGMKKQTKLMTLNDIEEDTYCQCRHGEGKKGNPEFLIWHRLYIYYFERVLRDASGSKTLTLPYWDWSNSRTLPLTFRTKGGNSLYEENRDNELKGGGTLALKTVDTNNAFSENTFGGDGTKFGFNSQIENQPHNILHTSISVKCNKNCPDNTAQGVDTGLMGNEATAAQDTIFWVHHSNIDRLLECWLNIDNERFIPELSNLEYRFVDENGKLITINDFSNLSAKWLNYDYEDNQCKSLIGSKYQVLKGLVNYESQAIHTDLIKVDSGAEKIKLQISKKTMDKFLNKDGQLTDKTKLRHIHLLLEGVDYDKTPGPYNVLIGTDGSNKKIHIGVMSFFASKISGSDHNHGFLRFMYVLDSAIAVIKNKSDNMFLYLEPTTGLTSSTVKKAQPDFDRNVNLRIRTVKLLFEYIKIEHESKIAWAWWLLIGILFFIIIRVLTNSRITT